MNYIACLGLCRDKIPEQAAHMSGTRTLKHEHTKNNPYTKCCILEGSLKKLPFPICSWGIFPLPNLQDVNQIQSSLHAFAALRSDGSVVTWGKLDDGGNSSNVQRGLQSRKKKTRFFWYRKLVGFVDFEDLLKIKENMIATWGGGTCWRGRGCNRQKKTNWMILDSWWQESSTFSFEELVRITYVNAIFVA